MKKITIGIQTFLTSLTLSSVYAAEPRVAQSEGATVEIHTESSHSKQLLSSAQFAQEEDTDPNPQDIAMANVTPSSTPPLSSSSEFPSLSASSDELDVSPISDNSHDNDHHNNDDVVMHTPEHALLDALDHKNINEIQNLLILHPHLINNPITNNQTPLHIAAKIGDPEIVNVLLQYGNDPTIINDEGLTPYQVAKNPTIQDMLQARTTLWEILSEPNSETLKTFLDDYCQKFPTILTWSSESKGTPLHAAVMSNEYKIVKILLEYKADPTSRMFIELTPEELAHHRSFTKIENLLSRWQKKNFNKKKQH